MLILYILGIEKHDIAVQINETTRSIIELASEKQDELENDSDDELHITETLVSKYNE